MSNEIRIEVIVPERFAQIKKTWIGDGRGLAVTGNESYRQVAELIAGYSGGPVSNE